MLTEEQRPARVRLESVTFPDSPRRWAFAPHFTDDEMESWRACPKSRTGYQSQTRTLAHLTPNLSALANGLPSYPGPF